jgi:hypothetical protein
VNEEEAPRADQSQQGASVHIGLQIGDGLILSIPEPFFSHPYSLMNLFLAILPELDFEIIT